MKTSTDQPSNSDQANIIHRNARNSRSKSDADHGVAAAAAAAADDARPCHGLLTGARGFRRGPARRGSSRSGWRLVCLRRDRASSSSSFLREAVAGAFGFSSATQVSPFSVSPPLHSIGQTRVVCLVKFRDQLLVTLTLSDGDRRSTCSGRAPRWSARSARRRPCRSSSRAGPVRSAPSEPTRVNSAASPHAWRLRP